MITVDSEIGKRFGFTSDVFSPDSYLWEKNQEIILSLITKVTTKKGVVQRLIKNIESQGYSVSVPTPLPAMVTVISRLGFKPVLVEDDLYGHIELWRKQ